MPKCKRRILNAVFCVTALCLLVSCASEQKEYGKRTVGEAERPAEPEVAKRVNIEERSSLSYGLITSQVQKGVTTQADLIQLFGGPNITTIDSDGNETWVYEKSASESEMVEDSSKTGEYEARRLDLFFGLGLYGTRQASGTEATNSRTKFVHSIKTLTVIVKFNKEKTVKEYSARAARF